MRIMVMANSWNMRRSSMGLFQFFKLFNAHIFANSLCSHKHNLLKISAMHYVIYVAIQHEDHTKKWNHIWTRFLLCSQRTLNCILFLFHPDCCSRIKKKYLSNYPTLCMHNKNISKRCFDFIKWFHLNYGQIRNWFCKRFDFNVLFLVLHLGCAWYLIFHVWCSDLSRQHIWRRKGAIKSWCG